jgi:hypothetical protein
MQSYRIKRKQLDLPLVFPPRCCSRCLAEYRRDPPAWRRSQGCSMVPRLGETRQFRAWRDTWVGR